MFTHKKLLIRALTLVVLLGTAHLAMTSGIPTAFADDPVVANPVELQQAFMTVLSMITTFMQILLLIILDMLGYLLQGDFFSDAKMMSSLNSIWVLSRNIMNIIFALMLIGVAFYTIITAKAELIKSKFAQFVIAVVLVNFSWFFPRVIIDVANILTATVYSVPGMLGLGTCQNFEGTKCRVIVKTLLLPSEQAVDDFIDVQCGGLNNATCGCIRGIGCLRRADYDSPAAESMNVAHATLNQMAVSFIHIDTLTQIPPEIFGGAVDRGIFESSLKIMINVMMVFVVQIGIVLPIIALGAGLFIRIIILWVTIAFMPFVFLGYVITGKLGTNIFKFETDLWQEFINAAFLPAVVAIPFTIGFIMLRTMATVPPPPGFNQDWGIPMINGVGSWWGFLWLFAAVGIIYVGAFAALKRSAITAKFTEKIKAVGDMAFGAAVQLPLLTPLPVPIAGVRNVGGLLNKPNQLAQQIKLSAKTGMPLDAAALPARGAGAVASEVSDGAVGSLIENRTNTQHIIEAIQKLGTDATPAVIKEELAKFTTILGGEQMTSVQRLTQFKQKVELNAELKAKINPDAIQKAIDKEMGRAASPAAPPPAAPPAGAKP